MKGMAGKLASITGGAVGVELAGLRPGFVVCRPLRDSGLVPAFTQGLCPGLNYVAPAGLGQSLADSRCTLRFQS